MSDKHYICQPLHWPLTVHWVLHLRQYQCRKANIYNSVALYTNINLGCLQQNISKCNTIKNLFFRQVRILREDCAIEKHSLDNVAVGHFQLFHLPLVVTTPGLYLINIILGKLDLKCACVELCLVKCLLCFHTWYCCLIIQLITLLSCYNFVENNLRTLYICFVIIYYYYWCPKLKIIDLEIF